MNLSAPFIRRPGRDDAPDDRARARRASLGFRLLPVASLPQVDFPTIQVSAAAAGRRPRDDGDVGRARRSSAQFGRIAGVTEMTSTSCLGSTLDRPAVRPRPEHRRRRARRQAAINAARGYLPTTLPASPSYRKVNPGDAPDPHLRADLGHRRARASSTTPRSTILQQQLSRVEGVGQVFVGGGSLPGRARRR